MEDRLEDDNTEGQGRNEVGVAPAATSSQRFRTMFRQNSSKIGNVAEVVLPMNKRSLKRFEDQLDGIDLESQLPTKQEVEVPVKKFPIFILTISLVQILVFLYGGENVWLILCYDPFRRHELWRYFTEMLVHKSVGHLVGNVAFQLILGLLLEIVHHWQRIGTVYMCGVLGGSLAVTILDPQRYSLGASAGVYGLLMAHLVTIILNWDQMDRKFCRLFWLLGYIGFDIGLSVYSKVYLHVESNISHAGHFGGAIGGFIAAVFVLRNFEKLAWEKKFQKLLGIITTLILLTVVIINISFPSHYLPSEFNFNYAESFILYAIKLTYNTPEWPNFQETCFKDEGCLAIYQEFIEAQGLESKTSQIPQ